MIKGKNMYKYLKLLVINIDDSKYPSVAYCNFLDLNEKVISITEKLDILTKFAEYYGHAFQIYDDILDVTASIEEIGKTPGKDANVEKSTYVSMYGLEEAKKQALFLCDKAYDILKTNNINSYILEGVLSDISEGIEKCC